MNALMQSLGLDIGKHTLAALLLPPVPWLLLILLGALLLRHRPRLGVWLVLAGVGFSWAGSTPAGSHALAQALLPLPPALTDVQHLAAAPGQGSTLILVLGGGRSSNAEYPTPTLSPLSMERLRYGLWLSRASGVPVAFSAGLSPGSEGVTEADLAQAIARDEFRHPLAWAEARSRDTHGNAVESVRLLQQMTPPVGRVVLVTHDLHQPRALRNFTRARDAAGLHFEITPAPVGVPVERPDWKIGDYLPRSDAIVRSRYVIREWLGLLAGA